MKKYIKFLFFICSYLLVSFVILSDDIVLDKIEILENKNCVVRIHNIDNPDNVKLKINDKIFNNFTINYKKIKSYFIILIDNSGSMILNDFLEIRDRIVYLLKNLDKENDLIKIYKINDDFELLFPTSKYQEKMVEIISRLQREGKKSRIFDAINDALTEANQLFIKPEYKDYDFYVMLFSDADDNVNPYVKLYNNSYVPFFYFSYFSKAEEFKTEKIKTLTKETKGNTLHKPTYEDINNLFFNKQKRYEVTLNIPLNKNEIINSKEYFLTILEGEKKLVVDIKKYFQLSKRASEESNRKIESSLEKSTEKKLEKLTNKLSQNEKSQKEISEKLQNQKVSQELSNEVKNNEIKDNENKQENSEEISEKIKEKELIENITNNIENINSSQRNQYKNKKSEYILNYIFSIDFIKNNILYIVIIFIILLILLTLLLLKKIIFAKTEKAEYSNNSSRKSNFSETINTNSLNESSYDRNKENKEKENIRKSDQKIEQQKTENKKQEEKKEENKQENKTEEKNQQQKNENRQDKQKIEELEKQEEMKKEEKEKEIEELIKKDFVKIKYIKDHLAHNKVSKFQLIYNRSANFIDEEEHSGEQILIESKLEIKNVEEKALTVKSDIPLLIENNIKLKEINFLIESIEYDIKTQDYTYYLISNDDDDKDILHLFSTKDTVLGERTLDLFGKATALVEKSISKNVEKERIKLNSVFETKIFKESESVFIELNYDIPVDTELEISNEESGRKIILNVKKVVFKNGKYKIYLS